MKSRMDRYKEVENVQSLSKRLKKNQELYQNIGTNTKYTNFTDVSNSNTYMINTSQKNNCTRENYQQMKEYTNIAPKTRVKKELEDFNHLYQERENRIYAINSVLEKAKENRKDSEKEELRKLKNTNYNILASINPEELEKYRKEKLSKLRPDEENLRELIDTITSKTLAGEISKDTGVDLLSDLMATNAMDRIEPNSKPEKESDVLDKEDLKVIDEVKKEEIVKQNSSSDIMKDLDKSFYTKSMDLSEKDFFIDDELENKKQSAVVKVLLFLILLVLVGISIYFVYQSF